MSVVPFRERSARAQVLHLRGTALRALGAYPVPVARLRLLFHGYNTTFRVDSTDGRRFALRISVNSRKAPSDLRAEMAWLDALARSTELSIPVPQRTSDGALTTEVFDGALGRSLPAALFGWLPGPDLDAIATPFHVRALGRAMAALHTHAEGWVVPDDATFPVSDDVLMHGTDHLSRPHPLLTADRRSVIGHVLDQVQRHYTAIYSSAPVHVLHADLHLGNAKWSRGRLSVFDFDDCVVGVPMHDLAVSTYYLRPDRGLEDALQQGYASARPLPDCAGEPFEASVAGRGLLLLNELIGTETADFVQLLPRFVANLDLKLRHYLDAGEFRHDLDGVVPLT